MSLLGSALNWWYGAPSQSEIDANIDATKQANQTLANMGYHTQSYVDAANADIDNSAAAGGLKDISATEDQSFWEGWNDGENSVKTSLANVAKVPLSIIPNPFSIIPGWMYLVGALLLLYYTGAFRLLRNIFKK